MFKTLGNFFNNKFNKLGSFFGWVVEDPDTSKVKIVEEAIETAEEIKEIMDKR